MRSYSRSNDELDDFDVWGGRWLRSGHNEDHAAVPLALVYGGPRDVANEAIAASFVLAA